MMKNILLFLALIFMAATYKSQQIKVRYLFVRSPVVTIYEDLYISPDGKVISVQKEMTSKNDNLNGYSENVFKADAFYYISNLGKNEGPRTFLYTDYVDDSKFFVLDEKVPMENWKIFKNETKKIAGYTCYKATTNFRGSEILAYYAPALPYSAGPYKFFGLPGLILDVRVKDKPFDMWKAEKVDLDNKDAIDFEPELKGYEKITVQNFVKIKDKAAENFFQGIKKNTSSDSEVKSIKPNHRFGVETHYEWE